MKNKAKIKSKNTHFCYEERVKIEFLLNDKTSLSEIARRLQRSKSSVSDEIKLNSVKGVYTAKKTHLKSYQRR